MKAWVLLIPLVGASCPEDMYGSAVAGYAKVAVGHSCYGG